MEDRKAENKNLRWLRWTALLLLAVVVWLFGLPLLERMQVRFERTSFEQVIRQLNAACAQVVVEAKATETMNLRDWLGRNPMACLEQEALSGMKYLEAETAPEFQPKATWMYEVSTGALRYRWRHYEQLISMGPERDIVRYRLTAGFADTDQNGMLDDDEIINGLYLSPVHAYQWHETVED